MGYRAATPNVVGRPGLTEPTDTNIPKANDALFLPAVKPSFRFPGITLVSTFGILPPAFHYFFIPLALNLVIINQVGSKPR